MPELCALGVGVLLRLSMALLFDARVGYDFNAHGPEIEFIARRHELPPLWFNATSGHPPLYHVIAAVAFALGFDYGALGWLSALWGMLRLALIWLGLERWLPESRLARVVALALAAVLPIGVHLDGMITNETLVMLMSAAVLVATPAAIVAARAGRVAPTAGLALLLGLAILSKVSALALVLAIAVALGIEVARAAGGRLQALRARLRPLVVGTVLLAAVTAPFFARNLALSGRLVSTGYEGAQRGSQAPYEAIPYLERRPLAFYVGWHLGIYGRPFFTTALRPEARFFPVLIASTFNDYYVFNYWGGGKYGEDRYVPGIGVFFGCLSNVAGTAIALVTVLAWLAAVRTLWRRREDGTLDPRFALLLTPLAALLGQLHFATKYPNDNFGPIKGAYLQFVAPVLCALFGVAVDWMWRRARWRWRVPALAAMAAVACVASYSIGARLPRFGKHAYRAAPFFASSESPPPRYAFLDDRR